MTLLPLLFWTLLLIPGSAVARRIFPKELEGGLLPSLAFSWACAFGALAFPVILGYLVGMSMGASVLMVGGFIIWGAIDLARTKAWRGLGRLVLASIGIEIALVVAEMVFSLRHGSILAADARVHLARIRFLYDHGLLNIDPFIEVAYPYPIYHTNFLHAICAIGSRMLGVDPLLFWFGSLPAAKLMIASGMAYLAWAAVGGRWAPWVVAVMVLVDRGPVSFSIYPNQLAPWFLVPLFVGVLIRALSASRDERGRTYWSSCLRVGLAALLVGMFHPLYAGFIVVATSPVVLGTAAWRVLARKPGATRVAILWGVVVLFAMPYPFVGKYLTVRDRQQAADVARIQEVLAQSEEAEGIGLPIVPQGDLAQAQKVASEQMTEDKRLKELFKNRDGWRVVEREDGGTWYARELGRGFTGALQRGIIKAWRVLMLVLAMILVTLVLRRREPWYLLWIIVTIQGIVLTPPLCALALRFLGAHWMLERFETLTWVLFYPLSVPVLAAVIERFGQASWWRRGGDTPTLSTRILDWIWRLRIPLPLVTALGIGVALLHATHRRPYNWDYYWNRVTAPAHYRFGREYNRLVKLQAFMKEHIPEGAVVMVQPFTGTRLSMLHDINLVASERSSTGVADGGRRRTDLRLMLGFQTGEAIRESLFDKYGVTHYVSRGQPREWVAWWDADMHRKYGYRIYEVAETPDFTELWRKRMKQGFRAMRAGRYDKAVEYLEETVSDEPRLERAWFMLGNAFNRQGDAVAAANAYSRAEEIDPEDPRYPLMAGNAAFNAERYDEALEAFARCRDQAILEEDNGMASSAFFNMGNTYYMLGFLEDAVIAYDRAIELDELHEQAKEYRGIVLEQLADDADSPVDEGSGADDAVPADR